MAPSAGSGWAGRRATAVAHPPEWVGERLHRRLAGSTVDSAKGPVGRDGGECTLALGDDRGGGIARCGGRPPAPSSPRAPTPRRPRRSAPQPRPGAGEDRRRPRSSSAPRRGPSARCDDDRQAGGARRDGADAGRAPRSEPAHRATTPRKKVVRRQPRARTRRRAAAHVALPPLPHLTLAHLSAPATTADAGRARKLAVGALSLLILALASATLLAFTARVERRRVVR